MKYERRPQFFENGRKPQFKKMEDDLNFKKNGRRPPFLGK
jgi:hypothetical protein